MSASPTLGGGARPIAMGVTFVGLGSAIVLVYLGLVVKVFSPRDRAWLDEGTLCCVVRNTPVLLSIKFLMMFHSGSNL